MLIIVTTAQRDCAIACASVVVSPFLSVTMPFGSDMPRIGPMLGTLGALCRQAYTIRRADAKDIPSRNTPSLLNLVITSAIALPVAGRLARVPRGTLPIKLTVAGSLQTTCLFLGSSELVGYS